MSASGLCDELWFVKKETSKKDSSSWPQGIGRRPIWPSWVGYGFWILSGYNKVKFKRLHSKKHGHQCVVMHIKPQKGFINDCILLLLPIGSIVLLLLYDFMNFLLFFFVYQLSYTSLCPSLTLVFLAFSCLSVKLSSYFSFTLLSIHFSPSLSCFSCSHHVSI